MPPSVAGRKRRAEPSPGRVSSRTRKHRAGRITPTADPFELPPTREATPAGSAPSSADRSPPPPPLAGRRALQGAAEKRRSVPLEMPAPPPGKPAPAPKRKAPAKRPAAADLTPEELGVSMSREQLQGVYALADRKAEAADAWRSVGRAVLSAANRQFAAMKTDPWRKQIFAKSSVKVGPIKLEFAKELFDVSCNTMLPNMAKRREGEAKGGPSASSAMTVSFTPKRRAPPRQPEVDEERPGFSAFAAAEAAKEEPAREDASSTEAHSDTSGEAPAPPAREAAPGGKARAALAGKFDKLDKRRKQGFEAAEAQRLAEWEREKEAWDEEQAAPKTSYGVRLREPQIARKLLRLPEQWKAFDYVSVAGHDVQHAKVTKVNMNYDVATQQLTLDCTVGYADSDAAAASSATP